MTIKRRPKPHLFCHHKTTILMQQTGCFDIFSRQPYDDNRTSLSIEKGIIKDTKRFEAFVTKSWSRSDGMIRHDQIYILWLFVAIRFNNSRWSRLYGLGRLFLFFLLSISFLYLETYLINVDMITINWNPGRLHGLDSRREIGTWCGPKKMTELIISKFLHTTLIFDQF